MARLDPVLAQDVDRFRDAVIELTGNGRARFPDHSRHFTGLSAVRLQEWLTLLKVHNRQTMANRRLCT